MDMFYWRGDLFSYKRFAVSIVMWPSLTANKSAVLIKRGQRVLM